MTALNLTEHPHRRFNPLTREWVLVSAHRTERPWLGQVDAVQPVSTVAYDPACYMCPGNTRAGGAKNPAYATTFVFDNDYPAVRVDTPHDEIEVGLFRAHGESGVCRVVCFSPRHDLAISRMEPSAIREVVNVWAQQSAELRANSGIRYVQIFENRGALMGASNPHPHCQIWATSTIPNEPAKEHAGLAAYQRSEGRCLLCDCVQQEQKAKIRIVAENDSFLAVVPFWAIWPFEALVMARRHAGSLSDLDSRERDDLASLIKQLTTRYDNLFGVPFPYSMGFHQSPTDGSPHPESHLHAHYYPPLLRSATVRKFMVGYEMLGGPQRDLTPEQAAERLRAVADTFR
ncbi:MAG TPA: UDP-glucose--hexose-1-phosphate uridylyltransferase [Candidatus Acidoferrales bacterium]|nr:UDP-glucose--hexose-1-phosphate uridylyltransferase [Candidatus Acidoferrales bacterium]